MLLGHHIQPDRRLIQQQQARLVQQRCGHLAAHALAKRQLAHRGFEQVADLKGFRQKTNALLHFAVFHFVDLAKQVEGVDRRQVIPQLRALSKDGADMVSQLLALFPGPVAQHAGIAHRWGAGCRSGF